MKNLKLETCLNIFKKLDPKMHEYLNGKSESELNMGTVSEYARDLKKS